MYVAERWLARLSASPYADDFVLKGGMLLAALGRRRPTVDADTLARNLAHDTDAVAQRVAEIAAISLDDGVEFHTDTVTTRAIRDEARYGGLRITMGAAMATARLKLQLDCNFGDPVTPSPRPVDIPTLHSGAPAIKVWGYPVETVIAEKFVTAIDLGEANTRVRDFADLHSLLTLHRLAYVVMHDAVTATSQFRGVTLDSPRSAFAHLVDERARTYTAYRSSLGSMGTRLPPDFGEVVELVERFGAPLVQNTGAGSWDPVKCRWSPDG